MNRETMTSRQRVTEAINHRTPDRVPIDMGMHTSTGISIFAYRNLRRHLGLSTDNIELIDCVQGLARVDEDVLRRFRCDCMLINPPIPQTNRWRPRADFDFIVPPYFEPQLNEAGEWVVTKGEQRMRMPAGGYFFDGDWISFADMEGEDRLDMYARSAERIYKETEYFTAFRGFYPFYGSRLNDFCDMITDPERLIEANKAQLKRQLDELGRVIDKMGRYIGAVCVSGDLGGQSGPMCKPSAFEQVSMPFLTKFISFLHRNSDLKFFLHSCGSIEPLIPMLIECGVDILNPVQISAANMNPELLKNKYGDRIVFWGGGVDTQHVLGNKQPHEVAENARSLVNTFKPNGGFVFCPVHNIMGDVPPENIVAAYDAAYSESFFD